MGGETTFRAAPCERARQWSSLRVDGELSEVESGLLDRHLGACAACRRFDAEIAATTLAIRAAEPEAPARSWASPRPVERSVVGRRRLAVLVAAALLLGALVGVVRDESPTPEPEPAPVFGLLPDDPSLLRELPRRDAPEPPRRPDDLRRA